ncbi:hypothetical protein AMTRI_Chr13g86020 [Amborella trichopoda]
MAAASSKNSCDETKYLEMGFLCCRDHEYSGHLWRLTTPMYKYFAISISNFLTTTCQYEVWSTCIMRQGYGGQDYLLAVLVTIGCSLFILYPAAGDISQYSNGRESTVWGISLMVGYLGFDGFTSTFQDKLFKGYNMEIYNQIFYTTMCSCVISLNGLIFQGHLLQAIDFVFHRQDCFFDIVFLSTVATISQFFISYTIRILGALTFATIMTTRQLVSILLSCMWFGHPLSGKQWTGAVIMFGSLYAKSYMRNRTEKPARVVDPMQQEDMEMLNRKVRDQEDEMPFLSVKR